MLLPCRAVREAHLTVIGYRRSALDPPASQERGKPGTDTLDVRSGQRHPESLCQRKLGTECRTQAEGPVIPQAVQSSRSSPYPVGQWRRRYLRPHAMCAEGEER